MSSLQEQVRRLSADYSHLKCKHAEVNNLVIHLRTQIKGMHVSIITLSQELKNEKEARAKDKEDLPEYIAQLEDFCEKRGGKQFKRLKQGKYV